MRGIPLPALSFLSLFPFSLAGMGSLACPSSSASIASMLAASRECMAGEGCDRMCLGASAYFQCNLTLAEVDASAACEDPYDPCTEKSIGDALAQMCASKYFAAKVDSPDERCKSNVTDRFVLPNSNRTTGETDVDCGGFWCARCQTGMKCNFNADCISEARCEQGVCTVVETEDSVEMDYFVGLSLCILGFIALFTLGMVKFNERSEKRRREKERRQEMKESQVREKETRKARMTTTSATKYEMPTKVIGVRTSSLAASKSSSSYAEPAIEGRSDSVGSGAQRNTRSIQCKSLDEVLADPVTRRKFYTFCKSKVAHENILFWEAVNAYEKMWEGAQNQTQIQQEGRKIVEKYISDVNIGSSCRVNLMEVYEKSDESGDSDAFQRSTFQEAKNEVFTLMNNNFFSDFLLRGGGAASTALQEA